MGQMQPGDGNGSCCGLTVHFDPANGQPIVLHGIKQEETFKKLARVPLWYTPASRQLHAMWSLCSSSARATQTNKCRQQHHLSFAVQWACDSTFDGPSARLRAFSKSQLRLLELRTQLGDWTPPRPVSQS